MSSNLFFKKKKIKLNSILNSNYTKKNVVILGGLSKNNLNKLKLTNSSEFAGISYFE